MQRRSSRFWLAVCLLTVLVPVQAAFVNNDTSGISQFVNFDNFAVPGAPATYGTILTDVPVPVFSAGGLTVNMAVPNYNASVTADIKYGINVLVGGFGNLTPTDGYILNSSDPDPATNFGAGQQQLEFTIAGGAVSAIGIRLTPISGFPVSNITLEAFDGSGNLLDFFVINAASTPTLANLISNNTTDDPSQGGFYGLSVTSNSIARFRITGGLLSMDDLGFGTLSGPDPEPDPGVEPIPEASTFLLCGSILGLLSLGGHLRKHFTVR